MSFTAAQKRRVFETKSGIVYYAGQGGILVFSTSFNTLSNAVVANVQQPSATVAVLLSVTGIGLTAGTILGTIFDPNLGTITGTISPRPNAIRISAQQIVGTAGVSEFSGTLPTFTLYVEGT